MIATGRTGVAPLARPRAARPVALEGVIEMPDAGVADVGESASRGQRGERGSAALWTVITGLAFMLVAATLALAGTVTVARHRAQAAADLAALAGALDAWDGQAAACDRAADVSVRNGASLVACRLDGLDAIVTVEVAIGSALQGVVRASARAGPVE